MEVGSLPGRPLAQRYHVDPPSSAGDVADWIASQLTAQHGLDAQAGGAGLMALTPCQEARRWFPDVANQLARVVARDSGERNWHRGAWLSQGAWLLQGVSLPLLWHHIGDRCTAEDLCAFYKLSLIHI